jgi:hypothetical protein
MLRTAAGNRFVERIHLQSQQLLLFLLGLLFRFRHGPVQVAGRLTIQS